MIDMSNHGGLPDYIADHFAYLVRCSTPARYAQLAFFGLGLLLPPAAAVFAPSLVDHPDGLNAVVLIAAGIVFAASFVWYVSWLHERQIKFRTEMPMSYARWFGVRRRGALRRVHPGPDLPPAQTHITDLPPSPQPPPREAPAPPLGLARPHPGQNTD